MLAAAIGIDRTVEGNVGRVVARDDGARRVADDLRTQGRRSTVLIAPAIVPPVVNERPRLLLIAPHRVGKRPSAPQKPPVCRNI